MIMMLKTSKQFAPVVVAAVTVQAWPGTERTSQQASIFAPYTPHSGTPASNAETPTYFITLILLE